MIIYLIHSVLSNLTKLRLYVNQLSGSIPSELGNLSNLVTLYLSNNQLTGSIPSSLGNLTSLIELGLNNNQLIGSIPSELGNLSNLELLFLETNQLTGNIPSSLGNLASLIELRLNNNQLTSSIPSELGNLSNLLELRLQNNQLSGCFVPELSALCGTIYDFTNNLGLPGGGDFATFCQDGTGDCTQSCTYTDSLALVALYQSTDGASWVNTWDLSQPMDTWYGVTLNADGCVIKLALTDNNLTGNIPPEIGDFENLTELYLQRNNLTGNIPPELGDLLSLTNLHLNSNQLTGSIPPQLGQLTNLKAIWLSRNELTGTIPPELGDLTSLEHLYLSRNELITGTIPIELGQLTNLEILHCQFMGLTGEIPDQLSNLTNLKYLIISSNELTGEIPSVIGSLSSLVELALNNNQLTGTIPTTLGNLSSLLYFMLNDNQFTGNIPVELANLNLFNFYLHNNQLSGCFPPQLDRFCGLGFNTIITQTGYNLTGNLDLPGGGDFETFCNDGTGACTAAPCFAVGDICGETSNTISIPVTINDFTNIGLFQFSIHVPQNVGILSATPTANYNLPNMDSNSFTRHDDQTLTVTWEANDPFEGETLADNTILFTIEMELTAAIGTSGQAYIDGNPTAMEVVQYLEAVDAQFKPGTICISPPPSYAINGQVLTYYDMPIQNVIQEITGDLTANTSTDNVGWYEFQNLPTAPTVTLTPSKNNDIGNGVELEDADLVDKHIRQIPAFIFTTPYQYIAADVNRSGHVSVIDKILIKQVAQGIRTNFPNSQSWRFVTSEYIFPDPQAPYIFPENRSYTPLDADKTNQDFIGVKLGDVNETANTNQ